MYKICEETKELEIDLGDYKEESNGETLFLLGITQNTTVEEIK